MSILIKNGRVITAEQDYYADIYISKDKITTIGNELKIDADKVIDAKNKYVIPGGVDVHTHLDMPFGGTTSSDDFESGTRAAAFGGTTCLIDFAIQSKGTRMRDALDIWWKKAEGKATIDYGLHMIITDLPDAHLEDMSDMVREGVTSFKLFMAYPGVLMVDDATIFKAMKHTAKTGALVCMHAENGNVQCGQHQTIEERKSAEHHSPDDDQPGLVAVPGTQQSADHDVALVSVRIEQGKHAYPQIDTIHCRIVEEKKSDNADPQNGEIGLECSHDPFLPNPDKWDKP